MVTESFFVFLCKGNQERTNIELGQVKGTFFWKSYHNGIHTYSDCFGATDDLAATFLYLSLLFHFVRLSPSFS